MSTTPEAADAEATAETTEEFAERLRELPPSAKLVVKVLETESGPLSQGSLADESLLPERTVRYALNRLEEADLVESRYSFRDARKLVYSLPDA